MTVDEARRLVYEAWKKQQKSWQARRTARRRLSAALRTMTHANLWVNQADLLMGRLAYSLYSQGIPVTACDEKHHIHVDPGLFLSISFFSFLI